MYKDTHTHTKWEGMGDIFIEHILITESHYKHTLHNEDTNVQLIKNMFHAKWTSLICPVLFQGKRK
jgi:hypothetical protein